MKNAQLGLVTKNKAKAKINNEPDNTTAEESASPSAAVQAIMSPAESVLGPPVPPSTLNAGFLALINEVECSTELYGLAVDRQARLLNPRLAARLDAWIDRYYVDYEHPD